MATTKGQVQEALDNRGELTPNRKLTCFYKDQEGEYDGWGTERERPVIRCNFDDLPTREFSDSWGGTEGEPVIVFSDDYVYIKWQYDGSEGVCAIPRHPEVVERTNSIPWPGGS